jgi:hypothetical protein
MSFTVTVGYRINSVIRLSLQAECTCNANVACLFVLYHQSRFKVDLRIEVFFVCILSILLASFYRLEAVHGRIFPPRIALLVCGSYYVVPVVVGVPCDLIALCALYYIHIATYVGGLKSSRPRP